MGTPTAWDSTTEPLCGENDPFGRKDTANQYVRELWSNFSAEHNVSDGSHQAVYGTIETSSYTGSGKKRIITLNTTDMEIQRLDIRRHADAGTATKTIDMESIYNTNTGSLGIESNGTDESTTFTDVYGTHTVTGNGGVKHDNGAGQWQDTAIYFDGSDDYLSIADHADWDFGTGLFSVCFDVYFLDKDANTYACFLDHDDWRIWYEDGNTRLTVTIEGTAYHFTWTPNENQWYRIKVTRISTDYLKIWIDDTSAFSGGTVTDNITGSTNALTIGCDTSQTSSYFFKGYLDDIFIGSGWSQASEQKYDWTNTNIMTTYMDSGTIIRLGTGRFQVGCGGAITRANEDGETYTYVAMGNVIT